jgi:ATP-dependent helicase/nuclease subunit A
LWDRLIIFNELPLSDDGKVRLQRIVVVLTDSIQQRRRHHLSTWIKQTWIALGGPACVLSAAELEDAQAFFDLLDKLEVAGDIPDLLILEKQVARLYSKTAADARVEVMTIHKAKGLEFDTVILPALHKISASDDPQLLLTMERQTVGGETDLLLAPIKSAMEEESDTIYDYLRTEEKKRADYETTRLLYVAVTRAKKCLHLLAAINGEDKKPAKNSLLAKLWPALGNDFLIALTPTENIIAENGDEILIKEKLLRRLSSDWQANMVGTLRFAHPTIQKDHLVGWTKERSDVSTIKDSIKLNDPSRHIGTVTHRLLQQICLEGIQKWSEETIEARQPFISNLLAYEGVIPEHLAPSTALVTTALSKTLLDPRGQWILDNQHQASQAEYPLTAVIDKKVVRVVIDRTFIDKNGTRWIIDYKTADCDKENMANFLLQEKELYRPQLEQYARIMRLSEAGPIKLALYFPLLQAWEEWEYK